MYDCDFLPHYFIWSTEDTQQLYPNRLVGSSCVQVCGTTSEMKRGVKTRKFDLRVVGESKVNVLNRFFSVTTVLCVTDGVLDFE